jgi:hypothetical protein
VDSVIQSGIDHDLVEEERLLGPVVQLHMGEDQHLLEDVFGHGRAGRIEP